MDDAAVFDQIAFLHGKVELAGRRIHRAAAHLAAVEAVAHGGDHLRLAVIARGNVGVAHAAGRGKHVALTASGAGDGHAHLAAVEAVDHVVFEDAVFNEDELGRLIALVIDVFTAPGIGNGAVVNGGDTVGGNLLSKLSGELAVAGSHGGRLEGVTAGLVEDDAAEAVVDDHRHHAGGAQRGVQHAHGRSRRLVRAHFRIHRAVKELKALHRAGVAGTGLVLGAVGGHRVHG